MALDLGTLVSYLKLDDEAFSRGVEGLPGKMEGVGPGLAAAGLAVGAVVGASLVDGMMAAVEADSANAQLAASLGLGPAEQQRMGEIAGSLYAQAYGDSIQDVNGAIESVISSIGGMSSATDAELEAATATAMNFGQAFEIDVARGAQVAGQMITSGLAGDATEAFDLLTAGMQTVPASMRENVLDALDEYGPFLSAVGIDGPQAMALLSQGAEQGQYGIDKIGDAIKELTIRSTDMSTASVAAYEAMGMNAEDMAARMLAGGDSAAQATDEIVAGLLSITDPTEQANAAIALFGTPLEDLGVQQIPSFLQALGGVPAGFEDVSGAAAEMGDTLNDTAATGWTELQRTWEGIWQDVAENLLPVLSDVTAWATENPAVLQAIALAMGVLALAFVGVTVATWAMNTALLASPITWIILGVLALVAAIVLLVMNWDTVVAWIGEVWDGFVSWLTESLEGLASWWDEVWAGFLSWIGEVWDGIVAWVQGVWDGFVGWLTDSGNSIAAWWNGLWSGIGAWVQSVWDGFVAWIMSVFLGYVGWLMGIGQSISSWWNGLWSGIGAFVQSVWQGFINTVSGIFRGFLSTAQGIGSSISSWWSGLWSNVRSGVESAWNGIVSWLGGIGGMILGAVSGAGQWLVQIGRDVINGLKSGLQSAWNSVVSWIEGLGGGIIDTFADILGIHSPSRVFRAFGVNIGEGLLLGLADMQPELDGQVRAMVTVPDDRPLTYDDFVRATTETAAPAVVREGDTYNVESTDPMAVVDEIDRRKRRAATLSDLDGVVGGAVR